MSADTQDPGTDPHVLSTLSDEERAAMAEHEQDQAEIAAAAAAGGGDDGEDDDASELAAAPAPAPTPASAPSDAAAAPAPADDVATAAAAAAPAAAPAPADAGGDDEEEDDLAPAFKAELPADFNDKVRALDDREAQAEQRLEDGEIDRAEHRRLMREIAEERKPLDRLQTRVELAQEMAEQAQQRALVKAADQVIKRGKADGVDYQTDDAKWGDLRGFVSQLEARNPGKSVGWLMQEAHKRVLALHDIRPAAPPAPAPAPGPAAAPAAAKPEDKLAAAKAARKPDLATDTPSIAHVPGGDGPGDVANEFADLLALDGEEYESAVARLTPAQRERFQQVA